MHIYLGTISDLTINTYNECLYKYTYYGHSMSLYHIIDPKYFKEFDHILHHTPLGRTVTCKSHGKIIKNTK
jgi:hypothetical protein